MIDWWVLCLLCVLVYCSCDQWVLGVRGLGVSCCCGWGSCVDFLSWFGLVGLAGCLGFGGWLICGF